ncbi:MAG: DUF58 domain-containing protein [Lutibacter sp.]|uniref:DUF58 domain-containing protein n=1 Tax=Lutibacter sp. TaxID=1925666 RepID=UPI00299D3321|nr:DUF58 domain-containing protein [Lutibacter sp.]MDX1828327.1 DUF58 domain-containing protein [Lutibacter sp.]
MNIFKNLYLHERFFNYLSIIAITFLVSFWVSILYSIAWLMLISLTIVFFMDIYLLFRKKNGINAHRILGNKFSNSDENKVPIFVESNYNFTIELKIIDELPYQFQKRDFLKEPTLEAFKTYNFEYSVIPFERGEYKFGNLNIYVSSFFKIISRRYKFQQNQMVAVYPSYLQMRKYEFLAMSNRLTEFGLKKIRKIGHTLEFEQIKNYVNGDDVRTINWKATAKKGQLMVNQFQDEKSQPIYSIIDVGRVMKMPFEELKLLDYAINATLAFSNIAIKKNDKAGLITFSKKVDTIIAASNKKTHLNTINEALYNVNTNFTDADFGYLYAMTKRVIKQRSLVMLYTNFEHMSSLKRQLAYLQAISKYHLLVVIFFENTELQNLLNVNAEDLQTIYHKTIAEKFDYEKKLIVKELESRGIYAILTKPKNLTINVINKYLEFKSKGFI